MTAIISHEAHGPLRVRVNDELVLDAGTVEPGDSELIIHPPKVTLFHQVLDYLRAKPDGPNSLTSKTKLESWATVNVVLRWGSYFAVLADKTKPVQPGARSAEFSRISDSEMARINIEASAALAEWIDISRGDTYSQLVNRAGYHLPHPEMLSKRSEQNHVAFVHRMLTATAIPEIAGKIVDSAKAYLLPDVFADVSARAEVCPSRMIANAVVNTAYRRNTPVESVHAGKCRGYSLDFRRVTLDEERMILGNAAHGFGTAMKICHQFALERHSRTRSEQALPYGFFPIAPCRWSFTESSREVRLFLPD